MKGQQRMAESHLTLSRDEAVDIGGEYVLTVLDIDCRRKRVRFRVDRTPPRVSKRRPPIHVDTPENITDNEVSERGPVSGPKSA